MINLFKLRLPKLTSKPRLLMVSCAHCGSEFYVTRKNIRAVNYCTAC